ncbi:MAG: phosphoribosylglycinamide formyltransferase [Ignavibacteria bacterium]|nr:phosphoribosylglycinamide formyltransferase [Ignavibacteria bacterium]MBT8382861.1 phosphoribosylglycinamide formyltransferase [Ignavibacteria bacterium]MBT8392856.1 phosphoribosylglycinamide formyltransferase [Ignavibacteria bacterium]NNJ53101.1 phosphoribosylglycinamide formyltransferase [Ignavibacteriaceae bacterium]NNL20643.1 phosphoribosylglycinamide formyltransferase [Ignavibacteriaceae bacterium]
MFSLAVFVSGRGSNLNSILNAPKLRNLIEVKAVVSNKADCQAFDIAKNHFIPVYNVGYKEGFLSFDELGNLFYSLKIDLIVLAGFLKLIPDSFVKSFKNKIINIHPALLPSFGGNGMYGMNVHKAVFDASAQISGASVHFVDETYDTGKIIAQRCVDISDAQSHEELAERVLKIEHQLLPFVIEKFALGKVFVDKTRVRVLN